MYCKTALFLLGQCSKRSKNSGFGLVELLGILLLLGIGGLISLAIPSYFTRPCKFRVGTSEAKQTIGALGRSQQAYFLEQNKFATSIKALQLGIQTDTNNYHYSLSASKNVVFHYAQPKRESIPMLVGGVFIVNVPDTITDATGQTKKTGKTVPTTVTVFCQEEKPQSGIAITALKPRLENQQAACPPHSIDENLEKYKIQLIPFR